MEDFRETCVTRIQGDNHIGIYTSERKYINQIMKLKEEYSDDVVINKINPDGSICADMPYDWFRMPRPKFHRNFTDAQRKAMSQRMSNYAKNRNNNESEDED